MTQSALRADEQDGLHVAIIMVADFLLPYGWHVLEHVDSAELAARYIPDTGRTIQSTAIEPVVYAEKR